MTSFYRFLSNRIDTGGFTTEDVLASLLPLMREALDAHTVDLVAPLESLDDLQVEGARIYFFQDRRQPIRTAGEAIGRLQSRSRMQLEIVGESRRTTDLDDGESRVENLAIGNLDTELTAPVYLPGYIAWEHVVGHHDPLTDIFSLGLLLASLACRLDLRLEQDLRTFVDHRRNLFAVNADLHPVLAQAIVHMTELDRHRRAQDLGTLIRFLENYREQDVGLEFDLARSGDFAAQDQRTKRQVVLRKLRERLFEISRRNRLLHFRATMQTVNLTHASVPLSFDVTSIRPDQILVWNERLQQLVVAGKPLSLGSHLNFSEALYLPAVLDRILADARRDQAEYGFAQLRLVICFLHWADFKQKPPEHYESPLVLLPVALKKKKGIRDTYTLEPLSSDAEINPVVRHQFQELYGIDLPESIDLTQTTLDEFYTFLAAQIMRSEPAVSLTKIDKPRIELVHEKARRRLDLYRRRVRLAGKGVRSFLDLDYSYDPANYHPLGITLFSSLIRPPETNLKAILEERPRPRKFAVPPEDEPVAQRERTFFHLQDGAEPNPYHWTFDLCSVTLGNFKYRKMSLVRDYETLLSEGGENPSFEAIFSLAGRPPRTGMPAPPGLDDRYDVVPCDPTQASAIEQARAGESYIIQGPPGTGKSQTIANLIADYVARGKRVLFVCEKRAAIDVVYARLRQRGLASVCSLIHDSQTDKRDFVMDLKQAYEEGQAASEHSSKSKSKSRKTPPRERLLSQLADELEPLQAFDAAMVGVPPLAGISLRELLGRAVALRSSLPTLSPLVRERLPDYAQWWEHRTGAAQFDEQVRQLQPDGVLAHHPLSLLTPKLGQQERPYERTTSALAAAIPALVELERALKASRVERRYWNTIGAARELVDHARRLLPWAVSGQLALLDVSSKAVKDFASQAQKLERLSDAHAAALEATVHWRHKLPHLEVELAWEQARVLEADRFAWFKPAWWRMRSALNRAYDFAAHTIRPNWSQVLAGLQQEYQAASKLEKQRQQLAQRFGLPTSQREANTIDDQVRQIRELQQWVSQLSHSLAELHRELIKLKRAQQTLEQIAGAHDPLCLLEDALERITDDVPDADLEQLSVSLPRASDALDELPDYLHAVDVLNDMPAPLAATLQRSGWTVTATEAAIAERTLDDSLRREHGVHRFTGLSHARHVSRLGELYRDWLDSNAAEVRSRVQARFGEHVQITSLPAAQLTEDQKALKRRYGRGRRELEHEFGKTMRYKPIRDLVANETGEVIQDLKPVWLMSPLSVSDTLPLDAEHFDAVIFDEASQVTLEEAVPAIFRARQVIVVGDEMQLPPTDFFSAKRSEEEELMVEEGDELVEYALDSDSLLNHAARSLPATMLGWHYRSRSESLISFSNWTFYDGRLLTVPEEQLSSAGDGRPLVAGRAEDAVAGASGLCQRAVSFHFMEHGCYEKRRNRAEADYIAHLVRGLFDSRPELSIGIVAFSEAQQSEIEAALENLANQDKEFRRRLDAAREREEDGQFVGLLVKNLENIQGDERDVILLSICYGHGPDGRMLMNFGPINKSGGEKRLNVAFSRAKHHMAVVSSIRHVDITNEYNDGANCLKNYLRYAEAVSSGDSQTAQLVLQSMSRWHDAADRSQTEVDPVVEQIAGELKQRGYQVDRSIGQSHFRCHLAVYHPGDTEYALGILVDTAEYYDQSNILERDLQRPELLRNFGWQVAFVLAKDWYEDRDRVLKRLLTQLAGEELGESGQYKDGPPS